MSVSYRLISHQGPTITSIMRLALSRRGREQPADLLERRQELVIPPRSDALIDAYLHHLGIPPERYQDTVPAHLFAQWGFAPMIQAIQGAPYNLRQALNGGCRLEVNGPIPRDEPLHIQARLMEIDDNGRRALLRVEIITGTPSSPEAVRAEPYLIIPLPSKEKRERERPTVHKEAQLVEQWRIPAHAGREFAVLTGDINPIHSLLPFARLAGFKGCILHGFSSFARSAESLIQHRAGGRPEALEMIEAKFTKAIVLPSTIGIYSGPDQHFFVGHGAGEAAFVTGTFRIQHESKS
jgi:hypothetical protein